MSQPSSAPIQIPDFHLLKKIGGGAYGEVWLAQSITGAFRAIKIISRDRFEDARPYLREFEGISRFARVSVAEPSQLALLHAGRSEAAFYYVMELADDAVCGRDIDPLSYVPLTFRELRRRRVRIPASEVIVYGIALSQALRTLHAKGLVHRDVKPSNIIMVGGVPKLADVGLVADASQGHTYVGTDGFVPPEGPGTPAADVFGLGKVLYELATGFDRHEYPRLPAELPAGAELSELLELNEVIIRACDRDPLVRFGNATAFRDELLLVQAGRSIRRLRTAERHLGRAVRICALLAMVACVAGAGAWLEHQRAEAELAKRHSAEVQRDELARRSIYSANLARAQEALLNGDYGYAREELGALQPKLGERDLRGFEWSALWREAQGDPARILVSAGPPAIQAIYSPDGANLAVVDADNNARVYDLRTGIYKSTIRGVSRLAGFTADGRALAGTEVPSGMAIWLSATGQREESMAGHFVPVGTDNRGEVIAIRSGESAAVGIWSGHGQAFAAASLLGAESGVKWQPYGCACISADRRRMATVDILGTSHYARWRWVARSVPDLRIVASEDHVDRIVALALNPDGSTMACAFPDRAEIGLYDFGTRVWLWRKRVGDARITALSFSPSGDILATGGDDSAIRLMEASTGTDVAHWVGLSQAASSVSWSPDGMQVAAADRGGEVRIYNRNEPGTVTEIGGLWAPPGGSDTPICFSPEGEWLAATVSDSEIGIFGTRRLECAARLKGAVVPLSLGPLAEWLYAATAEGETKVWRRSQIGWSNATDAKRLRLGPISVAEVSSDSRRFIAGTTDGCLRFCSLEPDQIVADQYTGDKAFWWISGTPDLNVAASGGALLTADLWTRFGARPGAHRHVSQSRLLLGAMSPNAKWLALGLASGRVQIRSLPDLELVREFSLGGSIGVQALAFSTGSDRLVCVTTAAGLHVLDTHDWHEIVTLASFSRQAVRGPVAVNFVKFSASGHCLVATSFDGRLRIWRW